MNLVFHFRRSAGPRLFCVVERDTSQGCVLDLSGDEPVVVPPTSRGVPTRLCSVEKQREHICFWGQHLTRIIFLRSSRFNLLAYRLLQLPSTVDFGVGGEEYTFLNFVAGVHAPRGWSNDLTVFLRILSY